MRLIIFSFFFLIHQIGQAQTIYVAASAIGQNDGTSWQNAYTDLQQAFAIAQDFDTIKVAQGIYFPTSGAARDVSFRLPNQVVLIGGFAGVGTTPDLRDITASPTILSGDIGVQGDTTDNSFTIMYMEYIDSATVVDGFIFEFGMANYNLADPNTPATSPKRSGGAMYMQAEAGWVYATIKNCTFRRNFSWNHGGAVYINGMQDGSAGPLFYGCTFDQNRARMDGGAIYKNGCSMVSRMGDFEACTFTRNICSRFGAVIYYRGNANNADSFDFSSCTVKENIDNNSVGGQQIFYLWEGKQNQPSSITIDKCNFESNLAFNYLFWMYNLAESLNKISSSNNRFAYSAHLGIIDYLGEVQTNDIMQSFKDTLISTQYVFLGGLGGGGTGVQPKNEIMHLRGYHLNLGQFKIKGNNYGDTKLSDVYIESQSNAQLIHALLSVGLDSLLIENSVFIIPNHLSLVNMSNSMSTYPTFVHINNSSVFSQALVSFSDTNTIPTSTPSVKMNNSYLSLNQDSLQIYHIQPPYNPLNRIEIDHCAFSKQPVYVHPSITLTNARIASDAMFVDSIGGDFRLQACSPLRNAGTNAIPNLPTFDMDSLPRIADGIIDIGPFEYQGFRSTSDVSVTPTCTNAGTITANTENGCLPLQYAWVQAGGTGTQPSGLSAGAFTVTITDGVGNQLVAHGVIPVAQPIAVQLQVLDATGQNQANGSITTIGITGGYPPYVFLWSDGNQDSVRTGLLPGYYPLQVTDAAGCAFDTLVVVYFLDSTTEPNASIFEVYPVPARNTLYIQHQSAETFTYSLTGAEGKRIASGKSNSTHHSLDINGYAPGYYILELVVDESKQAVRYPVIVVRE
jgi:Secretion system C-terminal sorting domain